MPLWLHNMLLLCACCSSTNLLQHRPRTSCRGCAASQRLRLVSMLRTSRRYCPMFSCRRCLVSFGRHKCVSQCKCMRVNVRGWVDATCATSDGSVCLHPGEDGTRQVGRARHPCNCPVRGRLLVSLVPILPTSASLFLKMARAPCRF